MLPLCNKDAIIRTVRRAFFILLAGLFLLPFDLSAQDVDFASWLEGLRAEALERGISEKTLDEALTGISPIERVIELDRNQPEYKLDFSTYLGKVVSRWRIREGRVKLRENAELLDRIREHYGVPPRFLVAIWGIETNFGLSTGDFPLISSLVTLAFDERRSDFFRRELLTALTILDEGHVSLQEMKGSWAGAMGQLQFMPSTFMRFAVDADGDGRKDIWNTMPDVMESAANFLSQSGWRKGLIWGRQVMLPAGFDSGLAGLDIKKRLAEWQDLGVRKIDGSDLPDEDIAGSIIMPSNGDGPAFIVYDNYRVILKWNRSHFYAVAVGHLADRIIGKGPLVDDRKVTLPEATGDNDQAHAK